jgi:hypothetical protein
MTFRDSFLRVELVCCEGTSCIGWQRFQRRCLER